MKNNNFKFKILIAHLFFFVFLFAPVYLNAQGTNPGSLQVTITNPFNCGNVPAQNCTIMTLILSIINNIIMPIAAVAVTAWIIWAGFQFVLAQGNEKKIETAKDNLLWSLIGAGILIGAVGIARVVESTVRLLITTP